MLRAPASGLRTASHPAPYTAKAMSAGRTRFITAPDFASRSTSKRQAHQPFGSKLVLVLLTRPSALKCTLKNHCILISLFVFQSQTVSFVSAKER